MKVVFVANPSLLIASTLTEGGVFIETKAPRKARQKAGVDAGQMVGTGIVVTQRGVKRVRSLLLEANAD